MSAHETNPAGAGREMEASSDFERNARLVGLWRGREIDEPVVLRVDEHALIAERAAAPSMRMAFVVLDGVHMDGDKAHLYVHGGDVLELTLLDDSARALLRGAIDAAFAMPELTRSLRAFGGAYGESEPAHDRWFAPLLAARRQLVGVSDPMRQLALFDIDRVGAELWRALTELAVQRTGGDAARARALEAILEENAQSVREAVARVALAATTLEGSAPDSRLGDWRRWVSALRELYAAADSAWRDIATSLRAGP